MKAIHGIHKVYRILGPALYRGCHRVRGIRPLDIVPGSERIAFRRNSHFDGYSTDNSRVGRTSMLPTRAGGIFAARRIASFRSAASTR